MKSVPSSILLNVSLNIVENRPDANAEIYIPPGSNDSGPAKAPPNKLPKKSPHDQDQLFVDIPLATYVMVYEAAPTRAPIPMAIKMDSKIDLPVSSVYFSG